MPGLTSVSPSEVFKEISNYNAQSLAPGELSHSTGTLYSSKSPPKKIVEPSKNVQPEEPPPPEIDIMAVKGSLKHVAPALEYRSHDQKPGTSCFSLVTLCIRYYPSRHPLSCHACYSISALEHKSQVLCGFSVSRCPFHDISSTVTFRYFVISLIPIILDEFWFCTFEG